MVEYPKKYRGSESYEVTITSKVCSGSKKLFIPCQLIFIVDITYLSLLNFAIAKHSLGDGFTTSLVMLGYNLLPFKLKIRYAKFICILYLIIFIQSSLWNTMRYNDGYMEIIMENASYQNKKKNVYNIFYKLLMWWIIIGK